MERENMWKQYSPEQLAELEEVRSRYKECLNLGKTAVSYTHLDVYKRQGQGDQHQTVSPSGSQHGYQADDD